MLVRTRDLQLNREQAIATISLSATCSYPAWDVPGPLP